MPFNFSIEIAVGRVLKINRDVNVPHAETADARGLIGQRLLMAVEREIDNVADAEGVDIGELRLSRLARRGDPIIEPPPI